MSDDVTIYKEPHSIPEYVKRAEKDEATKNIVSDNINALRRISIRGGVFRLMQGDTELMSTESKKQYWVIINGSGIHRWYFKEDYQEGKFYAPTCWSSNNKTPDEAVVEPMSTSCMHCSYNVKGSGYGNSRACRFHRKLAIVLYDDVAVKDGEAVAGDVYQVVLPSTSIFGSGENYKWPLNKYVNFLDSHKVPVSTVVTEVKFDSSSAVPKLVFSPLKPLSEQEYEVVTERMKEDKVREAVKFSVTSSSKTGEDNNKNNVVKFKQLNNGE